VGAVLKHDGRLLAVAASLTGGLLASAFCESFWFE
jgi:nicotinamide mononucleotide (NMN) deamidase PncC